MQDIAVSFGLAFELVLSGDPELAQIVGLSLKVSLSAVAWAMLIGFPLGAALGISRFPGPIGPRVSSILRQT